MAQAPIFVVGPPRSGTTLVAGILENHPDIYAPAPGETYFFEDVWSRNRELGKLETTQEVSAAVERVMTLFGRYDNPNMQAVVDQSIDPEALLERTRLYLDQGSTSSGYAALYTAFTTLLAENAGKKRFCDDTPKHLFHLHAIFDMLPEEFTGSQTKAIACVRDVRDFLCSYRNWWKKSIAGPRLKSLYHPIVTSLLWNSSVNLIQEHAQKCCKERVLVLQYEALVRQPVSEVKRISEFLDLGLSDDVISSWIDQLQTHNSSFDSTDVYTGSATGIFSTSIDHWQEHLSQEEIWWAQRLSKRNMKAFSYPIAEIHPSFQSVLSILASFPSAMIKAIRFARRGPLVQYAERRISALLDKG